MDLQDISRAVAAHLSAANTSDLSGSYLQSTDNRQKKIERWGLITGLSGLSLLFLLLIGFFLSILAGKVIGATAEVKAFFDVIGPWVGAVALPLLLGGSVVALYPHMVKELARLRPSQPVALPQTKTSRELPLANPPELIPSVTEQTTRNLE